jgi:hypothetical protein
MANWHQNRFLHLRTPPERNQIIFFLGCSNRLGLGLLNLFSGGCRDAPSRCQFKFSRWITSRLAAFEKDPEIFTEQADTMPRTPKFAFPSQMLLGFS